VNGFLRSIVLLMVVAVASAGAASSAGGSAAGRIPNPCRLLAAAHATGAFSHGMSLAVSHRQALHERFSGVPIAACTEMVGSHWIELTLSTALRGVESVDKVRSQKQLSGLGPGATLTIYTRNGAVAQAITFRRGVAPALFPTYASITLLEPTHLADLKVLARRLYEEL
jgi:hypothetical protein